MWTGTQQRSSVESVTVLWPVRVWVSVQGFHVNVQGWEWETPVAGGQTLGLAHGISVCPRLCARTGARSPPPWPQFPMVAPPSVDGGYAGHLASCLAAPQHGGHHRFTRGILRGRGKMCSQEPRSRLQLKEKSGLRGHSWNLRVVRRLGQRAGGGSPVPLGEDLTSHLGRPKNQVRKVVMDCTGEDHPPRKDN